MILNHNKGVSIIVITYNSSKTILETLESIKNQSYKNISLIICDDCSKDETISICENWVEENKYRFLKVVIFTSEKNQGIGKNMNRGLRACTTEWLKTVSGDDILEKNCIKNYFEFIINSGENINVLFSKMISFNKTFETKNYNEEIPSKKMKQSYTSKEQLKLFLKEKLRICAPTAFFRKEFLKKHNFFEEKYKFMEDYPTWYKFLKSGEKFYFLNKVTVFYRLAEGSLSGEDGKYISERVHEFKKKFYNDVLKFEVKDPFVRFSLKLRLAIGDEIIKNGNRGDTFKSRFYKLFIFDYLNFIMKILKKNKWLRASDICV